MVNRADDAAVHRVANTTIPLCHRLQFVGNFTTVTTAALFHINMVQYETPETDETPRYCKSIT